MTTENRLGPGEIVILIYTGVCFYAGGLMVAAATIGLPAALLKGD